MKESLLYGLPGGIVSGFFFLLLADSDLPLIHLLRQALVMLVVVGVTLYETRKKNTVYFPYKFAWFSGFNTSFIAALSSGICVWLLASEVVSEEEVGNFKLTLAFGFTEFLNMLFLGLVLTTGLSWRFRIKK